MRGRALTLSISAVMVLGVLGVLGVPAAVGHEQGYPSSVSIHRGKAFYGRVDSAHRPCKRGRKVKIYRIRWGEPDIYMGSDITSRYGRYNAVRRPVRRGWYQARVGRSVRGSYGHTHKCRKARSGRIYVRR